MFSPSLEFIWTTAKIISLQMSTSKNIKASVLNHYFANALQTFDWHPFWHDFKSGFAATKRSQLRNSIDFADFESNELALSSSRDFFSYLVSHRLGQKIDLTTPSANVVRNIISQTTDSSMDELKELLKNSDFGRINNESNSSQADFGSGIGIISSITTIGSAN